MIIGVGPRFSTHESWANVVDDHWRWPTIHGYCTYAKHNLVLHSRTKTRWWWWLSLPTLTPSTSFSPSAPPAMLGLSTRQSLRWVIISSLSTMITQMTATLLRTLWCSHCCECRRQRSRNWAVPLWWEIFLKYLRKIFMKTWSLSAWRKGQPATRPNQCHRAFPPEDLWLRWVFSEQCSQNFQQNKLKKLHTCPFPLSSLPLTNGSKYDSISSQFCTEGRSPKTVFWKVFPNMGGWGGSRHSPKCFI